MAQNNISEKRRAANRANAARSTGPRTPEGKARSAQNSRKHGLTLPRSPIALARQSLLRAARLGKSNSWSRNANTAAPSRSSNLFGAFDRSHDEPISELPTP